ncbi:CvpA family protein, partial [Pseudomonas aeruginosa]
IIAACALLFIATLLLGALVNYLIGELIRVTGLSGTDRFLGMVFGGARGVLLVVLLVGLLSLAPVQQDPWWQQSVLMPHFLMVADWSKNFILGFAGQWLPAAPITPPSGIGGLLPSQ